MDKKLFNKTIFVYLVVSAVTAVFGAVYEYFSHEVYSYSMMYAFLLPLIFGAVVWSIIGMVCKKHIPCAAFRNLYHSGVATFTVGSIFNGIIEIYGTTSEFVFIYVIAGIALFLLSMVVLLIDFARKYEP